MMASEGDLISRREALELLDFEIEGVQGRVLASGWTSWGLLVALGGVVWKLLDLLTLSGFDRLHFFQYIVAGYCGREVLTAAVRSVDTSPDHSTEAPRFHWSSTVLGGQQLGAALQLLEAVGVAAIAIAFRGSASYWGCTAAILLATLLVLGNLSLLFTIYSGYSLPISSGGKPVRWVSVTRFFVPASALVAAVSYGRVVGMHDAPAMKAAGLALALFVLAEQMAQERAGHPLLEPLVGLRRNLARSRVSVDDALRRMEILLEGEDAEHLLQDDLAAVLRDFELHTDLARRIREVAERLSRSEAGGTSVEGIQELSIELAQLDQRRQTLEVNLNHRVGDLAKKQQQVAFVLKVFGAASTDSKLGELLQVQLDLLERMDGVRAVLDEAQAAVGRLSASIPPESATSEGEGPQDER